MKYPKKKKLPKPISIDSKVIEYFRKQIMLFYGDDVSYEMVVQSFYFCLGQLSVLSNFDKNWYAPLLNSDGVLNSEASTMNREMIIEGIAILQTGYEYPNGRCSKKYAAFFADLFERSLSLQRA